MKNFLWALLIIIVLGGGYLLYQSSSSTAPADSDATDTTGATQAGMPVPGSGTPEMDVSKDVSVDVGVAVGTRAAATVSYDGKSFSPSEVTIKKGGTVTWKNSSNGTMWVASAQHPSHTVYAGTSRQEHCPDTSGTAFDQCAGETGDFSFTFGKVGTWGYHDHINTSAFGKIIVVE